LNVTVSRRVNPNDGSFAGIVVASVSMDFFRKLRNNPAQIRRFHQPGLGRRHGAR
jgi:hypothetical protein